MAKANTAVAQTKKSTAVAVAKTTAVAAFMQKDAGAGFEGAGREAFAIPFLAILQSGSPQVKKSEGAYIKGAEEGNILNTVSLELWGEEGVEIIPCAFNQSFVEWKQREQGGGYVAEYDSVTGSALRQKARRDDKNRDILPNGHQINDTRNHYVLFKTSTGSWQQALLSLTSTQIKASRNWMSGMLALCEENGAPMYGLRYQMKTTAQSNDKGSWFGASFEFVGMVEEEETYNKAKAFHEQAKAGQVKVQPREGDTAAPNDPDEM